MKKNKFMLLLTMLSAGLLSSCTVGQLNPASNQISSSIVSGESSTPDNSSSSSSSSEEIVDEEIYVTGVQIDAVGTTTVTAGNSLQLTARVLTDPEDAVLSSEQSKINWKSSNLMVATVDETGLVKFLGNSGASAEVKTVTITATSDYEPIADEDSITFTVNPSDSSDVVTPGQNFIGSTSAELTSWNSNVAKVKMDGTSDFKVTWSVDNTYTTNDPNNSDPDNHFAIYYNWVTEIYSADADWANSGITVRNDWCGWTDSPNGTWTIPEEEKSGADFELYKQMLKAGTVHAKIVITYTAASNKITVEATTTSDYVAGTCNSLVTVYTNGYKGPMWVSLGGEKCRLENISLTINSGVSLT